MTLQALDREVALGERGVHCHRAHMSLHRSPCLCLPYRFGGVGQPNVVIDSFLHAFSAFMGDGAYPRVEDDDRDDLDLDKDCSAVGGQPAQMFESTHNTVLQRSIPVERVEPFAHGDT
jgi:hypothetical protein